MDILVEIEKRKNEYKTTPTLEKLSELRRIMAAAQDANETSEGFRNLLTQLYPDNAHFIYELLQNAQDASKDNDLPITVRFTLTERELVFEHNGNKLFDIRDVDSITGLGVSTKIEDKTNIGKFGVGFKSVFAITDRPEIISGNYHFAIERLFVPILLSNISPNTLQEGVSRFTFPFNNAPKAIFDIEQELCKLGSETLLFLKNINKIEYLLPNGKTKGYMEREEEKDGVTRIIVNIPDKENKVYHWLKYEKTVAITDENGKSVECPIAIAFKLEKKQSKENHAEWKIEPIKPKSGNVFIYFPAASENSGLRFYIHAPFASTVARDSVRDCAENRRLRNEIAELVAESLEDIKSKGLLTMDFLAVLPNMDDELGKYKSIRKEIIQAFQTQFLVPTESGDYAPATKLYRTPLGYERIKNVVDDMDLSLLTGHPIPLWVKNTNFNIERQADFLDCLEIDEWGRDDLEAIFYPENYEERRTIEKWVQKKTDRKLLRLYALMEDLHVNVDADLHIVRITSEEHINANISFFSIKTEANVFGEIKIIKKETYTDGADPKHEKLAREFLERIGARHYDSQVIIETRLYRYEKELGKITDAEHLEDISLFLAFLKNAPDKINIFKNKCRFKGIVSEGNNPSWLQADLLFIDSPYKATGLEELRSIHGKHKPWRGYVELLSEETLIQFVDFLVELGVMDRLRIAKTTITNNTNYSQLYQSGKRNQYEINEDYTMKDVGRYMRCKSITASRLIWEAITSEKRAVTKASYRPNYSSRTNTADSQIVNSLKGEMWIPDIYGAFRTPSNMTEALLRPDFPFDDTNGLLQAIGFGHEARTANNKTQENQKQRIEAAATFGESLETIENALEVFNSAKDNDIDISAVIAEVILRKIKVDFPEDDLNPQRKERREQRVAQEYSDAQKITYDTRERSVRTSAQSVDKKIYLRDKYTNRDNKMFCQICQTEMPFKGRDREYYFEAVSAFNTKQKKRIEKECEQNNLALCPLCAAKFKEFISRDDEEMDIFISAFCENESCEIPIRLGDEEKSVRFTDVHMSDLKTVLALEGKIVRTASTDSVIASNTSSTSKLGLSEITVGTSVVHKNEVLGNGVVCSLQNSRIVISFNGKEKVFSFPDAFLNGFLRIHD
jgi:hypothetical protein